MGTMAIEIIILLALIVVNGVLAMSEIAVVSARTVRLERFAEEGSPGARAALRLSQEPSRFLSTVQIGITLVGILAGAYGGAALAGPLAGLLAGATGVGPYAEELAIGIVVVAITFLTLVIGELVPKRVAMSNPERIASLVARPMHLLSRAAAPLVFVLSATTEFLVRIAGIRESEEPPATDEEIASLIAAGAQTGAFEREEEALVQRVFRFSDQEVQGIMTPRRDLVVIDLDQPKEKTRQTLETAMHSRYVVCRGGVDNALGLVEVKRLLAHMLRTGEVDVEAALRTVPVISERMPTLRLLERFKQSGEQVALIVDEFGGISGMVTLDDILEAIVGDIPWSGEAVEPEVIQQPDGSFLVDGMTDIGEFKRYFGIRTLPGEDRGRYQTVGGFVIWQAGHIPEEGAELTVDQIRFRVTARDGNRIQKVRVFLEPAAQEPSE